VVKLKSGLAKSVEAHSSALLKVFNNLFEEMAAGKLKTSDETLAMLDNFFGVDFPRDLEVFKAEGMLDIQLHAYTLEYRKINDWIGTLLANENNREADNLEISARIMVFIGKHTQKIIELAEKQSNENIQKKLKNAIIAIL
jgi:hypothetical protein